MIESTEQAIRPGGDPGGFAEHLALRAELGKLNHPACPDVNWEWVEHQCLSLFQVNGVELHCAAAFALARTRLYGLPGLEQGLALISGLLSRHGKRCWPPGPAARQPLLSWLAAQLQPLVRGLQLVPADLPLASQIQSDLAQLSLLLERQMLPPIVELTVLRQQLGHAIRRLEREAASRELVLFGGNEPGIASHQTQAMPQRRVAAVMPPRTPSVLVVTLGDAPAPAAGRKPGRTLSLALLGMLVLCCLAGWGYWAWRTASQDVPVQVAMPDPVQLDSLSLFPPGSAQLKPESTKLLIKALDGIKAQPGWLIEITGHSDTRGSAEQNLELSKARAAAVRDWMQTMGDIPDSCFAVRGVGASRPIGDNQTLDGRAANRRVDIRLMPVMGACVAPIQAAGRQESSLQPQAPLGRR